MKKILIFGFGLLIVLAAVSVYLSLYNRLNLVLINKFAAPNLTKTTFHKIQDGYSVCFALSDSFIYIIDTTDSTNTSSYCYNYHGVKQDSFNITGNTGYGQPFDDKSLSYLSNSNQLVYNDFDKQNLDYYDLYGNLIKHENNLSNIKEYYLDMVEFQNKKYFTSLMYVNSKQEMRIKMNLYEEQSGKLPKLIRSVSSSDKDKELGIGFKVLQIDNNGGNYMAVSEVKNRFYNVMLYDSDKIITINIPKKKTINNMKDADIPFQFILGRNFLVMGSLSPGGMYPLKQNIYNLKGRFIGKLEFKDDPKNELVDIVGDRLVAFNPMTSTISIYQIKVK